MNKICKFALGEILDFGCGLKPREFDDLLNDVTESNGFALQARGKSLNRICIIGCTLKSLGKKADGTDWCF
jgi:hypothetical protein